MLWCKKLEYTSLRTLASHNEPVFFVPFWEKISMNIIFDYNRTLFNPDSGELYPGVIELLETLTQKYQLFLITRNEPGRSDTIATLGIAKYFQKIAFVEEKTTDIFQRITDGNQRVIVIGDRLQDEIQIGNTLSFPTIHVEQGEVGPPNIVPTHRVKTIQEVRTILENYE